MDTDFILKQVQHMGLPLFSVREQNHYRAEKMLMRQFMLLKQQCQVPIYLSVKEMKSWLMAGRSFLDEFQEIAEGTEARKLLMAELAWTSARRLCLNQMEQELLEELEEEKRLSLLLRRRVTLEGLQMFLSIFLPKAEKDVQTFLRHLSNKLLISFTGCHSSRRSKLALFTKLQRTTAPLVSVVMETALRFLLDKPEPLAEVKPSQTWDPTVSMDSNLASTLGNRAEAASAEIGKQLADTTASCFCLVTSFTKAHLLHICTPVARNMVKAIYKRFDDLSKSFHLLDFDESFVTAGESIVCAVQDMDDRVRAAAYSWALHQLVSVRNTVTPEVCSVAAAERTDQNEDKEKKQGVRAFFSRMWKKIIHVSTEE
ncbi:uncharacterized protein LOC121887216 isoform X1 [Thunnus maccoyii]|uniref:uncharacterized protein LOC121887216 isoform X1 n=1 Tax=Thunnus maccoyii TaxID=8240 RepID=UPI001C4C993D|nr:uncharacterized protein LOC121887216 isoform X1 [Thunnus maccoyii]